MAATGRTEARPEEPRSANTPGKPEELAIARRRGNNKNGNIEPEWQCGMDMMKKTRRHMERFTHEKHTRSYLSFMRRYEKVVTTTYHV